MSGRARIPRPTAIANSKDLEIEDHVSPTIACPPRTRCYATVGDLVSSAGAVKEGVG
jgi:hypothetical protein